MALGMRKSSRNGVPLSKKRVSFDQIATTSLQGGESDKDKAPARAAKRKAVLAVKEKSKKTPAAKKAAARKATAAANALVERMEE